MSLAVLDRCATGVATLVGLGSPVSLFLSLPGPASRPSSLSTPPHLTSPHRVERNGTPLGLPFVDERPESVRDGQSPMSPGDNDGDVSEGDEDSDLSEDENNGNPLPLELYSGSPGGKALLAAIYPYIRAAAKKEKPSSLCSSLWAYTAFYESEKPAYPSLRSCTLHGWSTTHSATDLLNSSYCDALEASRDDFEKARESLELTSPDRTPSLSPNVTPCIREAGPVERTASLYSGLEGSVEFEV
ncbi:hypothetical protein EJ02DRAFT_438109 [Clathrospora elynae]|uniref:Uncharacterized protein n=1 Tax=Clathrospora elynae TaxID=706981 RepID=A0A6A5SF07_9PLEO|nr:hypothetical protein EJ02DRAFT_438109 [Clathrospora elynae]